ncbi:MAG: DNA polymerase Y family protein [Myxococcota bacterium]
MGTRTACLLVPDLPLAAELRAHPEWSGEPLGVASAPGPRAEMLSVSAQAARRGVCRGQSVTHARSVCSELRVRVLSPSLEHAARDALRDVALAFSPRVAPRPRAAGAFLCEAAVLLDASGIGALFHSEEGFAAALGDRARRVGLPAHVAVAGSQDLAHLAARRLGPCGEESEGLIRVVPAGGEAAFLAPLPIDLLDPDDALAERLGRFGVRTLRDLLALPRRELVTRLGVGALALADLARGRSRDLPLPAGSEDVLVEAVDLEHPVDRQEPLLFVLQGLLSRLLARLEVRHLGCGALSLQLDLDGGGRDVRRVGVAAPTRDLRVLIRLLHQALEARAPEAAVETVRVETRGVATRSDQLDLFRPAGPAPDTLSQVLAELSSLCGDGHVGAPAVADSHHPDALALRPFPPKPATSRGHDDGDDAFTTQLALRVLRPPVAAQVRLQGDRPASLRSPVANGSVLRCAGPWRTTGGWWSEQGRFAFDHFDVLTHDGTVSRLRFDHVSRSWQIDAVYD